MVGASLKRLEWGRYREMFEDQEELCGGEEGTAMIETTYSTQVS